MDQGGSEFEETIRGVGGDARDMPGNPIFLLDGGNQHLKIRLKIRRAGLSAKMKQPFPTTGIWRRAFRPHNREPMRLEVNHRRVIPLKR
jgi:hypothetical protein